MNKRREHNAYISIYNNKENDILNMLYMYTEGIENNRERIKELFDTDSDILLFLIKKLLGGKKMCELIYGWYLDAEDEAVKHVLKYYDDTLVRYSDRNVKSDCFVGVLLGMADDEGADSIELKEINDVVESNKNFYDDMQNKIKDIPKMWLYDVVY